MAAILYFCVACSRLQPLTSDRLTEAEAKWKAHRPDTYRLVIEMSGDRIETGHFDVSVARGQIISLRSKGLVIHTKDGQDYSMDVLFHILGQELVLAERPATLGAPEGYSVYINARFDDATGRL